ncbi:hypothetical protein LTR62_001552 [Meristemomyces frigidus]|uniref:Cupin type-2 domain-containing protein n=1 Tax=Meristemomyces frigidus TaxID=1508187 RepID=A0AAN7TTU6_9PEZI|nr:hypothetical protein LTR62_001552 [Meristemomyces frigidus]
MGGVCSSSADETPGFKSDTVDVVCLNKEDIAKLDNEGYNDREHGKITWKIIISSDRTPTNSLTAGIATCKPKRERRPTSCGGNIAPHRHWQAKTCFFLSGEGVVNVDLIEYEVKAGSVVFIPGNAEHSVRNQSLVEDLVWYYCIASNNSHDVKDRFSCDVVKATTVNRVGA